MKNGVYSDAKWDLGAKTWRHEVWNVFTIWLLLGRCRSRKPGGASLLGDDAKLWMWGDRTDWPAAPAALLSAGCWATFQTTAALRSQILSQLFYCMVIPTGDGKEVWSWAQLLNILPQEGARMMQLSITPQKEKSKFRDTSSSNAYFLTSSLFLLIKCCHCGALVHWKPVQSQSSGGVLFHLIWM